MNYDTSTASGLPKEYITEQKSPQTAKEVIEKYKTLESERLHYLYAGRDIDRVTFGDELILGTNQSPMSGSLPQDGGKYRNVVDKPFHDVGGRCLRGLSSRQYQYLFPQNTQSAKITISKTLAKNIQMDINNPKTMSFLNQITDEVMDFIDLHEIKPAIKRLLERMNIEGLEMIHISESGIRVIPLRSFTIKRDNGKARYSIIAEELEGKGNYYTYVNFEDDEVWQVSEKTQEMKRIKGESCIQYIPVCSRVNPFTNFAYSYAWQHFPMLNSVNVMARSIDKISYIAGLTSIMKDPDANMSNEDVKKMLQENQVFNCKLNEHGDSKYIGIFSAAKKIPDLNQIEIVMQGMVQRLEQSFGLKIFPGLESLPQMTATQARLMAQEIENEINSHCATLVATLLVPLIKSILWVLGYGKVAIKIIDGQPTQVKASKSTDEDMLLDIEPVIGMSQLSQQIQLEQMWTLIKEAYQTNPQEAMQRISVINFVELAGMINNLPGMQYIIMPPPQQDPNQEQGQLPSGQMQ